MVDTEKLLKQWSNYATYFTKKLKVVFMYGYIPLILWIGVSITKPTPSLLQVMLPFLIPPENAIRRIENH